MSEKENKNRSWRLDNEQVVVGLGISGEADDYVRELELGEEVWVRDGVF